MRLQDIAARVANLHVAWVEPSGGWKYFHVSATDLGDSVTFAPQIPSWVKYASNEDFTTKRVCLAPSVRQAMEGRFGTVYEKDLPQNEMFVYAIDALPDLYTPNSEGCPEDTPGNPYGLNWSWQKYAEEKGLDPKDKEAHAEAVKGCIPDPKTGEVWSLQPVTLKKIGRLWNGPDGRIKAKWSLRETKNQEE